MSPRTSGELTFPWNGRALPAGDYVLRWISNGQIAQSATFTLADMPPSPVATSLDPGSVVAGAGATTLRVVGSGFTTTSRIRTDGTTRMTAFVSATELRTTLAASELTTVGTTLAVTVLTPPIAGLGGGETGARTLSVVAPPARPTISGLSPMSVAAGTPRDVTVNGAEFVGTSRVRVDGVERATAYVSATQLTVTLTAADVASGGPRAITVMTPTPGGGTSAAAMLTVVGPAIELLDTVAARTGPIRARFANGPGRSGEWIAVFPAGGGGYVDWQWVARGQSDMNPHTSGELTFPWNGRALPAGEYVLRWISSGQIAQSATFTLADIPAAPTLTRLDPGSVVAGTGPVTLAAFGTGFTTTSGVRVAGVPRATTFVSTTELRMTLAAGEAAAAGAAVRMTVLTPPVGGLGGGETAEQTLNVVAPPPAPTITSLSQSSFSAGAAATSITVNGTNFVGTSRVRVDGSERTTTFVSAGAVMVLLTASDLAAGATRSVTVVTPAPGGGTSNAATLTVVGPAIGLLDTVAPLTGPIRATFANGHGRMGEWIAVFPASGGGYVDWQWVAGGQTDRTAYTSGDLTFPSNGRALPAGDYVLRWISGGQIAQSATFTLADMPPTPVVTGLDPGSVVAGAGATTLRVVGSGFTTTSRIQTGGTARATTFVSATELRTTLAASELTTAGTTLAVTVLTPPVAGLGGGETGARTLSVVAPPARPTISGLSPASVAAGTPRDVTVNGAEFVGTSRVRVDGVERATAYVSATQLTVMLTAADVVSGGPRAITVVTPTPGGGASDAATLTVVGPALELLDTVAARTGPIRARFANGPGRSGEWIAVFPAGGGGYVDWQWVARGQSDMSPHTSGELTFPWNGRALPAGEYVLRWISGGQIAQSATFTLADVPSAPTLTSVDPGSVVAGSGVVTFRARGSGFTPTSVLRVGGADHVTTFVSSTELTAVLTATETGTAGTSHPVIVRTPPLNALGGGDSVAILLAIVAPPPAPTIVSLSPTSVTTGGASAMLVVNGGSFVASSRIRVDGVERTTTFVGATELRTTLSATDLASNGTRLISVVTPAPGGGASADVALPVAGPSLTLDRTTAGIGGPFSVTLANGRGGSSEWIGVFPASSTGAGGYVDWQWVSGGRSNPGGPSTAPLWFPTNGRLPAGSYLLRWISNGVVVAQSGVISLSVGTAPAISNLSFSPASVTAGSGTVRIDSLLDVVDPDGDVDRVRFTMPSGATSEFAVPSLVGYTSARAGAFLLVDTSVAGNYPFTIQLIDRSGNVSNGLNGVFTVTAPGGGSVTGAIDFTVTGGVITQQGVILQQLDPPQIITSP